MTNRSEEQPGITTSAKQFFKVASSINNSVALQSHPVKLAPCCPVDAANKNNPCTNNIVQSKLFP